jgi:hypothetical protein
MRTSASTKTLANRFAGSRVLIGDTAIPANIAANWHVNTSTPSSSVITQQGGESRTADFAYGAKKSLKRVASSTSSPKRNVVGAPFNVS